MLLSCAIVCIQILNFEIKENTALIPVCIEAKKLGKKGDDAESMNVCVKQSVEKDGQFKEMAQK